MKVEIEEGSGFCFGVENAVRIAEETLSEGKEVYCLGNIVHNEIEVERLREKGLITINHDQFAQLKECKVLIRAHGEPPSTYETARKNNIEIIDATCPIVHTLQERIKKAFTGTLDHGGQIVIYGKEGHAEVIGLQGAADGHAVIITGMADLDRLDYSKPIYLFSQTTMSKSEYTSIAGSIRQKVEAMKASFPEASLKVFSTICGQVSGREPRLRSFSGKHDVIVFVSGKSSSNGRMLYEVCRSENSNTHFISSVDEIDKSWFAGAATAGVCGATSTPRWLIREVAMMIEKM